MSEPIPTYTSYDQYPNYTGSDLELTYCRRQSAFRIWSPAATAVRLLIYERGIGGTPILQADLHRDCDGTWTHTIVEDMTGLYYTFQVQVDDEWLDETPGIYAKAVGINGKRAAIIDFQWTNPKRWEQDVRPPLAHRTDAIIYEVHTRDFSMSPDSGMHYKGKFLAFTEEGTHNSFGQATGLEHLKELGVTHIHLMPAFDFATIDERKLSENKYNWGYDPANYNVPEGSYSTNPDDPSCRIREFKQMILSLHRAGLRVVMDVVYNHTYATEDSNFNKLCPGYYYRQNPDGSFSNASGCGNETASERFMVRKYIVDSVRYWASEYHIDGFRFDLMGIHDVATMQAVRSALDEIDPSILLYGEGWTAGDSPLPFEQRAVKHNLSQMPGVAAFSDDLRDGLKGTWANAHEPGFACGHTGYDETVKFGVVGATQHDNIHYGLINYSNFPYATEPEQVINYISCHDDLCLIDKLSTSAPYGSSPSEMRKYNQLAQTIIFTAQGIPVLYAGEELSRTKQGVHNSYQSSDSINQLVWDNKKKCEGLYQYYRNLIQLRRHHPAFRLPTKELIQRHLHFLDPQQACVVAYTLDGHAGGDPWNRILVIYNGNRYGISLGIPKENWRVCCNGDEIRESGIFNWSQNYLNVPASSAMILYTR